MACLKNKGYDMKKTNKEVREGLKPTPTRKTAYELKEIIIRSLVENILKK